MCTVPGIDKNAYSVRWCTAAEQQPFEFITFTIGAVTETNYSRAVISKIITFGIRPVTEITIERKQHTFIVLCCLFLLTTTRRRTTTTAATATAKATTTTAIKL